MDPPPHLPDHIFSHSVVVPFALEAQLQAREGILLWVSGERQTAVVYHGSNAYKKANKYTKEKLLGAYYTMALLPSDLSV